MHFPSCVEVMLSAASNGKTHGFTSCCIFVPKYPQRLRNSCQNISIKSAGQMYQAPSKKASNKPWMLTKAVQAPDNRVFTWEQPSHPKHSCEQLFGMDGQRAPQMLGNSTASRMQTESVSFRAKLQHLLLSFPFHNSKIMFSPFTETLRDVNQLPLVPGLKPHIFF